MQAERNGGDAELDQGDNEAGPLDQVARWVAWDEVITPAIDGHAEGDSRPGGLIVVSFGDR